MKGWHADLSVRGRFQLLDQVRSGEIRPEDAEKQAALLGLAPLEYRPDPSDFDPMTERLWTLPMAIAWIVYRTAEAVRQNWCLYRVNCFEWRFIEQLKRPGCSGFDLFAIPDATLSRFQSEQINTANCNVLVPFSEAITLLWSALCESRLESFGVESNSGSRAAISALSFQDLELGELDGHDVLRTRVAIGVGSVRYTAITLPVGGVIDLWGDGSIPLSKTKRGGRPPKYDWPTIDEHAISLLDQHGGIDPSDKFLPTKAALIRLVLDFCSRTWDMEPSQSQMKERAPGWISRYEKERAGN